MGYSCFLKKPTEHCEPFFAHSAKLAFLADALIAAIGCTAMENMRQTELLKVMARKGN